MLVSVIIPNYNHASFLKERIDSVLNQSYTDFEIIILDDCSNDNSRKVIESYRNNEKISHILYNEINSGTPFKQWNKGIAYSKGELIWIAESDDKADAEFLSSLVSVMSGNEKIGLAYCQSHQIDDKSKVIGSWLEWTDSFKSKDRFYNDFQMSGTEYIINYLIHKNTIPNASAVVFKKVIYNAAGGADESIKNNSDWFTWIKLLMISNIFYSRKPLNYYRRHDQSVIARAVSEMNEGYNFEINGGVMREKLKQYLDDKANDADVKKIRKINTSYLIEEISKEGLFLINQKQWIKGWIKIISSYFVNPQLHYIKSGLKLMLKPGLYNR